MQLALKSFKAIKRKETLFFLVLVGFIFVLFSFLSLIPTRAASAELSSAENTHSLTSIYENPVNAPYKLATYAVTQLSDSVRVARFVSLTFYLAVCVAMFYSLRHWHTLQASLLTTLAFASNSVLLATGRLGTPLIVVVSFFIFMSSLLWKVHTRSKRFVPVLIAFALASLLYVPGILWFAAILGIVYINKVKQFFKNTKKGAVATGILLALAVITPLILGFVRDTSILKEWLLLPDTLIWENVPRAILKVPSAFIYRMPAEPLINIGRLPIFDITSGIIFLIGLYAYARKLRLDRTKVMVGSALVGCIIGAIGQTTTAVIMLLPFAYSIIAAGIEYLLDEWHRVFPKNPVARSFGMVLVTTVMLFSVYYQLIRFFVVWPQAPETRNAYNQSRIIQDHN